MHKKIIIWQSTDNHSAREHFYNLTAEQKTALIIDAIIKNNNLEFNYFLEKYADLLIPLVRFLLTDNQIKNIISGCQRTPYYVKTLPNGRKDNILVSDMLFTKIRYDLNLYIGNDKLIKELEQANCLRADSIKRINELVNPNTALVLKKIDLPFLKNNQYIVLAVDHPLESIVYYISQKTALIKNNLEWIQTLDNFIDCFKSDLTTVFLEDNSFRSIKNELTQDKLNALNIGNILFEDHLLVFPAHLILAQEENQQTLDGIIKTILKNELFPILKHIFGTEGVNKSFWLDHLTNISANRGFSFSIDSYENLIQYLEIRSEKTISLVKKLLEIIPAVCKSPELNLSFEEQEKLKRIIGFLNLFYSYEEQYMHKQKLNSRLDNTKKIFEKKVKTEIIDNSIYGITFYSMEIFLKTARKQNNDFELIKEKDLEEIFAHFLDFSTYDDLLTLSPFGTPLLDLKQTLILNQQHLLRAYHLTLAKNDFSIIQRYKITLTQSDISFLQTYKNELENAVLTEMKTRRISSLDNIDAYMHSSKISPDLNKDLRKKLNVLLNPDHLTFSSALQKIIYFATNNIILNFMAKQFEGIIAIFREIFDPTYNYEKTETKENISFKNIEELKRGIDPFETITPEIVFKKRKRENIYNSIIKEIQSDKFYITNESPLFKKHAKQINQLISDGILVATNPDNKYCLFFLNPKILKNGEKHLYLNNLKKQIEHPYYGLKVKAEKFLSWESVLNAFYSTLSNYLN